MPSTSTVSLDQAGLPLGQQGLGVPEVRALNGHCEICPEGGVVKITPVYNLLILKTEVLNFHFIISIR